MPLQPADYVVVATGGKVGALIRWFERHAANQADRAGAWANHVALYIGNGWVIEATPNFPFRPGDGGLIRSRLSNYDHCTTAYSIRPLTTEQRMTGVGVAEEMADAHLAYNFLDIAALGFSTVGVIADPVWNRLNNGHRLICSEAVARTYRLMGDPLTAGPDCRVTPAHLARQDVLSGAKP